MSAVKFYYQIFPIIDDKGKLKGKVGRPIVQFLMNYKHGGMVGPLRAIVDSGADYNLFPADLGELLGIKIKKGETLITVGIGGKRVEIFRHYGIRIFIEGYSLETFVDFSYDVRVPLLGQQGFFDKLKKITFDRVNEEFYVEI